MIFAGVLLSGCQEGDNRHDMPYAENWESLEKHQAAPEWFRNAKLGIYFHWGVYTVPAFGSEWYPRQMYLPGTRENAHHLEMYGPVENFNYHDFVPEFKAEHFDPKAWVQLFQKAGARFIGPVAEHHDGFSMWASRVTPWNSLNEGPHRDVAGELASEARQHGLKFITTFHHARNLQRYRGVNQEEELAKPNPYPNSHYPFLAGTGPASDDDKLKYLYGNIPEEQWLEEVWLGKLKEVVDNYQPDIMWFDSWLDQIPEIYRQRFCAYYLNQAAAWDKEVVLVRKQDDLPLSFTIDDFEKSRKSQMDTAVWMTDETISTGSWCYTEGLQIKPAAELIRVLIDIVSKNGVLLLNISPRADGIIPDDQQETLLGIGAWLERYGEAIYKTRPWITYGEGPTVEPEGGFAEHQAFLKIRYTNQDIRYTTKGRNLYAMVLGAPADTVHLTALNKIRTTKNIEQIELMGSQEPVTWEWSDNGLKISIPPHPVDTAAIVYRIVFHEKQ